MIILDNLIRYQWKNSGAFQIKSSWKLKWLLYQWNKQFHITVKLSLVRNNKKYIVKCILNIYCFKIFIKYGYLILLIHGYLWFSLIFIMLVWPEFKILTVSSFWVSQCFNIDAEDNKFVRLYSGKYWIWFAGTEELVMWIGFWKVSFFDITFMQIHLLQRY